MLELRDTGFSGHELWVESPTTAHAQGPEETPSLAKLRVRSTSSPAPILVWSMFASAGAVTSASLGAVQPGTRVEPQATASTGVLHMSQGMNWDSWGSSTVAALSDITRKALLELRRLSGLTWAELARLFGVSRRSLHFWASGTRLSAGNEEKLYRLLAVIRKVDRGTAQKNRLVLLTPDDHGDLPLDLLRAGEYQKVARRLAPAVPTKRPSPSPLSPEARKARAPAPPEVLAGALPGKVHRDTGKARPVLRIRRAKS